MYENISLNSLTLLYYVWYHRFKYKYLLNVIEKFKYPCQLFNNFNNNLKIFENEVHVNSNH